MCTLRYLIPEREYAKVFKKGELCLHGLHGPIMSLAPSEPLHWLPALPERLAPSFHPMRLLLIVSLFGPQLWLSCLSVCLVPPVPARCLASSTCEVQA